MRAEKLPEACQQVLNPEELASAIRSANLEPSLLSTERSMSRIARVVGSKSCLDLVRLGPAMLFTGAMPSDSYTLMFMIACPKPGIVKKTALEWGFWHMGHFGESYRSLFGESPGATVLR